MTGVALDSFTHIWSIDSQVVEVGPEASILPREGERVITLTVSDDLGNYGEASVTITVSSVSETNMLLLPLLHK